MILIMDANEALKNIYGGQPFTYSSIRKKGRTYSITVIEREKRNAGCDLFIVKANDLKHSSGTYNKENITEIINKALNNQPQRWRIN